MANAVSKSHTFLHHNDRAICVPNALWSSLRNAGVNGVVVRETNYPVEGVSYVETDEAGARWFIRTALYETGRLSPKGRADYEWEAAQRVEAALRLARAA